MYDEMNVRILSWIDYTIFIVMLVLSVLIGIYFGFYKKKNNSTDEYLLGGKNMNIFPVSASLISSHISAITVLGLPSDVYKFGSNHLWIAIAIPLACIISTQLFLPIFFKLQLTSIYEYFKLRFDNKIRIFVSFLFVLSVLIYNPIVIYIPSLAFAQATGLNTHLIVPIICAICIFYTAVGGLKAVIWTDALQFIGMIVSGIAIFFVGASYVGGFETAWKKALLGQRLDVLDFTFDPTLRDSFGALVIGGTLYWTSVISLNQTSIQKFLSLSTLSKVKRSLLICCIGLVFLNVLGVFTGLIIYARYEKCDPVLTKQIKNDDQVVSYFLMEIAESIPGLPGLFMAGIFSASLSTFSSTLNTVAAVIYKDFLTPFISSNKILKYENNILKLIVIIAGILCSVLTFMVENVKGMFVFNAALQAICMGPNLGLFLLGSLFPFGNSKGALCGGIGSLIFTLWMVIGNQWYISQGLNNEFLKPLLTEDCEFPVNFTVTEYAHIDTPFIFYRFSHWYESVVSAIVTLIIGLVVSFITRKNNPTVDPAVISPVLHFLLK